jgi:phage terminase large subunit
LTDSIERRSALRRQIGTNPKLWELELAECQVNLPHWLTSWVWTYDPRELDTLLPFDPFPKQLAFLRWLRDRERAQQNGLAEKSRDMGVTWLCVAYAVHGWLFRPGFAVGFGSSKLELVDKIGDPKSIFEKIRFLLRNLPDWMLPPEFDWRAHDNQARLVNPSNGATITGEGGDQIGRGDRRSIYFVDEAAFLDRPDLVERSLSQTTRCRIDVSTPNGPGNPFARKRYSGKVPVFTFHWRDDPRKGEDWYRDFKARHDPVTVAQEADIDYSASVEGICIPAAWVRAAVNLNLPESGQPYAGLDISDEGKSETVLACRRGPVVKPLVAWGQTNTTRTAWRARDESANLGVRTLYYDVVGVGSGVKGTWQTAEKPLPFRAVAVNVGETPSDAVWPDGKTSREKFLNLRAELWWKLRTRFERAYEFKEHGTNHPPEDMISIPDDPELIAQLSSPLAKATDTGKIKLESKDDMRRRGVKSPDRGDAVALAFHDDPRGVEDIAGPPASVRNIVSMMPRGVFRS